MHQSILVFRFTISFSFQSNFTCQFKWKLYNKEFNWMSLKKQISIRNKVIDKKRTYFNKQNVRKRDATKRRKKKQTKDKRKRKANVYQTRFASDNKRESIRMKGKFVIFVAHSTFYHGFSFFAIVINHLSVVCIVNICIYLRIDTD